MRRDVSTDDLEHLAYVAFGRSVRHHNAPARPAHPYELRGDAIRPGSEHRAHEAHDEIEG
jgi:hypothetical protein